MRNFQELHVWHKSHALTLKIYDVTRSFPKQELFGLTSQMRRSSSSISTNIAEGCGRNSNPDFKRFLTMAAGSTSELQYQLLLSKDLNYISQERFFALNNDLIRIRKMIYNFSKFVDTLMEAPKPET